MKSTIGKVQSKRREAASVLLPRTGAASVGTLLFYVVGLAHPLASLGYLQNPLVLSMRSVGKFGQRVSGYAGFIHSHLFLFYTPYYTV